MIYRALSLLFVVTFCVNALGAAIDEGRVAFKNGDYVTAAELFAPLAAEGSADAQYYLGVMHQQGWGLVSDPATAAGWSRSTCGERRSHRGR